MARPTMAAVRRLVDEEVLSLSPPAVMYSIDPQRSIKKKTTAAITNPSWIKLVRKSWRMVGPLSHPNFPKVSLIAGFEISAMSFVNMVNHR